MAKRKLGNYLHLTRHLFEKQSDPIINQLSGSALRLYCWLCELEHRFVDDEHELLETKFFHTNEELARLAALTPWTVKRAKRELKEYGLIETGWHHWRRPDGRKSRRHVTDYYLKDFPMADLKDEQDRLSECRRRRIPRQMVKVRKQIEEEEQRVENLPIDGGRKSTR